MIKVVGISIEEFEKNIYDKYIKLFPDNELREWEKIKKTYENGIEHFYKIVLGNEEIGFIMLEKLDNKRPYYLDYFGIYQEYQDKGYGSKAIKYLLDNIVCEDGLIGDIEEINDKKPITKKRFEFYKNLGFVKIESVYLFYNVYYNPIVYLSNEKIDKEEIDKIFFDYYLINLGQKELEKNGRIIG